MTTDRQKSSPMSAAELQRQDSREWVTKHRGTRSPGAQTQLLFNLAMPTSVFNRATRVGPPAPIVIEKLVPPRQRQDDGESCSSSLRLSVLSEDRLQAAVRLAKRDLRRKRQQVITGHSPSHVSRETSPSPHNQKTAGSQQNGPSLKETQKTRSQKRQTKSCSQVLVYTPQKLSVTPVPDHGQSPPTRDPGLRANSSEPQLSREIRKLQKELATYIQRIEQLANKEQIVESVEPDEKRRMEIRRQEQAARSARIIYGLQQQVKEIQEDIDKLRSQSARPTKKSRAVERLAAAHRGAVRAMQVFINQLSDPAESRVLAQCKELGQLIRQLSLCSAKVDVGQSSNVPETTLDILQKLETLDSALSKQAGSLEGKSRMQSASPARERSTKARAQSMSPPRAPRALTAKAPQGLRKSALPKKTLDGRRMVRQPQRAARFLEQERSKVLKAGIQSMVHQMEQREKVGRSELHTLSPATRAVYQDKSKGYHARDVGFQQPTVSSRLRESQLPQKETSVPWIPTSPHSPTKQRAVSSRPEPRCLFSPGKSSSQPTDVQPQGQGREKISTQQGLAPENIQQAHNEALRQAWLERITEERLRELNQLSKEETERINRLRTEVESPTQWAERAELAARERLQPLLDDVQEKGEVWNKKSLSHKQRLSNKAADKAAVDANVLSEAILEDLLEDAAAAVRAVERERSDDNQAQRLLQVPTLESMLLRMEEMEKDQEEVRRRFAMISYSDLLLLEKDNKTQRKSDGFRPGSPQPIRLTKPFQRPSATGDILLQRPVETGMVSESSILDEEPSEPIPSHPFPGYVKKKGGISLNVPSNMQKNIQQYREAHDSYLHLVSHEVVGSFNPWAVAESLSEELMAEALADVAAEFQHVCEEYAEAVFTSEFLQPVQSPSLSVS
ncbi:protein moonraker isoform X2 [Salminus brasiliensis]|uniref:protein moonraker isoform X2 n=1 Tax=Salminus brasiliensis TaxID=930266 RepID=UPI003B8301BA